MKDASARSHTSVAAVAVFVLLMAVPAISQQRPLRTDDASLLATGRTRIEFGFEFLQGQKYPLSGLEGDLTRIGVAGVHVGVGEYAEFQVSGVIHDFLSVSRRSPPVIPPDFGGNSTSDFGDLVLATKLKLAAEQGMRPAMAFKFAVQLPNAGNESGLGTDTTKFFASLLLAKQLGRARLLANAGLAILPSPVEAGSQADLVTYGLAAVVPLHPRINLAGEINGRGGAERLGNESQSQARLGLQLHAAGLRWDVAGVAGLESTDANSGLVFGVTYEFQAFGKKRGPRTIK